MGLISKLFNFRNKNIVPVPRLFTMYYDGIWEMFVKHGQKYLSAYYNETNIEFRYELLAYMHALTGFCIGGKKCKDAVFSQMMCLLEAEYHWYHGNNNLISNRFKLYMGVISGEPVRAEWVLGDTDFQPLIKTFIAFGDILYNPACSKDYQNAPTLITDINETAEYAQFMFTLMQLFKDYTDTLIKEYK